MFERCFISPVHTHISFVVSVLIFGKDSGGSMECYGAIYGDFLSPEVLRKVLGTMASTCP